MKKTFYVEPVPASRARVTRWSTYFPKRYTEFKKTMEVATSEVITPAMRKEAILIRNAVIQEAGLIEINGETYILADLQKLIGSNEITQKVPFIKALRAKYDITLKEGKTLAEEMERMELCRFS